MCYLKNIFRIENFIPHLFLMSLTLMLTPAIAVAQTLEGVWLGTEIETIGGDNAGVVEVTNPRILIYTEGFFSWTFENADRPATGPDATDAQIADAMRNLNVAAGTYVRDGATIHYIRRVTNNPNGMLPENQPLDRTIRALTATMLESAITDDEGVTTILRYRRIE
jgi:hypothetical protein